MSEVDDCTETWGVFVAVDEEWALSNHDYVVYLSLKLSLPKWVKKRLVAIRVISSSH